jgi:hypothetical protein
LPAVAIPLSAWPSPAAKPAKSDEEARRWRAYLTVIKEGEPEEVVVYCPDCAERQFERDNG